MVRLRGSSDNKKIKYKFIKKLLKKNSTCEKLSAHAKVSLYKSDPLCKSVFVQFYANLSPCANLTASLFLIAHSFNIMQCI